MIFQANIDVTKNTSKANALQYKLPIMKGVINQWVVFFPRGSWAMLRFSIQKGSEILFPANRDGYIAGEGNTLTFPEWIYIREPPYVLDIYGHNLASDWNHSFILYVSIIPLWTFYPFSREYKQLLDREITDLIF